MFDNLKRLWDKAERPPAEGLLPSDVRFALEYRNARLKRAEITQLATAGFVNEAAYLLLKGAVYDPTLQCDLLRVLVSLVRDIPNGEPTTNVATRNATKGFVLEQAARLPTDDGVAAGKLARISRQGFRFWDELYHSFAHRCATDDRDTFLIGHATFIGLVAFIQSLAQAGKKLSVLIPELAKDQDSEICGYALLPETQPLRKDFPRSRAVIIDDVKHTGACLRFIDRFWNTQSSSGAPDYELTATVPEGVANGT